MVILSQVVKPFVKTYGPLISSNLSRDNLTLVTVVVIYSSDFYVKYIYKSERTYVHGPVTMVRIKISTVWSLCLVINLYNCHQSVEQKELFDWWWPFKNSLRIITSVSKLSITTNVWDTTHVKIYDFKVVTFIKGQGSSPNVRPSSLSVILSILHFIDDQSSVAHGPLFSSVLVPPLPTFTRFPFFVNKNF